MSQSKGGPYHPQALVVDSREPEKMIALLQGQLRSYSVEVFVESLSSGDYKWGTPLGSVGVERKTVANLVQDITNGVADTQLARLISDYKLPVLLVEGTITCNIAGEVVVFIGKTPKPFIKESAVRNWLVSRQLEGVYVDYCLTSGAAARIVDLYKWSQTISEVRRPVIARREALDPQLAVVAALPGIGVALGTKLLRVYGSVDGVFQAIKAGFAGDVLSPKVVDRLTQFLERSVDWKASS